MFGNSYGTGRSAFPTVYSVNQPKRAPKKDAEKKSKPKKDVPLSPASLGPAIDGPPSPERIRAYTEQMKRSSIFGGSSRSNTFSSSTPSFRSRESVSPGDNTLSRKSSARSTTKPNPYAMPDNSLWAERPESMQILGGLFSRSGRKSRKSTTTGSTIEEEGRETESRARKISTPYNFQHLTHTQQQQLPNLGEISPTELVSEFSAIRASQIPSRGELKGIRAQDLHFSNFSSESLSSPIPEDDVPPAISPKSPRRQHSVRKQGPARLLGTKSQDNLSGPPVRPPRSPRSEMCPIDLPARTSSRTASILFDTFDPLATTTLDRPQTNGGFRRPAPFKLPEPVLPPAPSWNEADIFFTNRPMSHAVTTPGDEAWPLSSSSGTFGAELADVLEEEEPGSRLSKISYSSNELRGSLSVPALRLKSLEQEAPLPIAVQSEMTFVPETTVLAPAFQGLRDSWEDDVDFCYENEIEANFDYQWDSCDVNDESERTPPAVAPQLHLHLDKENQSSYLGRFRPALLTPGLSDTPEISPISDPRTPAFMRPASNASSFKESHGFHLSPSLIIPNDFRSEMERESLQDEHFDFTASAKMFPEIFQQSTSPMDESIYSTSSYRSSAFSRGSARSSSSTRVSTINSRASQDSVVLLNAKAHNSISSASSLPELIPSMLRNDPSSDSLVSLNVSIPEDPSDSDARPAMHRRNKSLAGEPGSRKGVNHFAPVEPVEVKNLSPVAETFLDSKEVVQERPPVHTRKASVPLAGIDNAKFKMRARASTASSGVGKPRTSYGLFPQVI